MENWWSVAPEFWKNKTQGNLIYAKQKEEVVNDLSSLIVEFDIKNIIDVGGYQGEIGKLIEEKQIQINYTNLDFITKVDLTKDWIEQGLEKPKKEETIVATSLCLIAFPPEDRKNILKQMFELGKVIYCFEEVHDESITDGQRLSNDFGGKWAVTLDGIVKECGETKSIRIEQSKINNHWVRYTIIQ